MCKYMNSSEYECNSIDKIQEICEKYQFEELDEDIIKITYAKIRGE